MMRKLGTLAIVPLFLVACEPRDETADDVAVAEEREHQVGDTENVNLSEINDSGVSGDARLTVLAMNETDILVEVSDARPNSTYQAAIHQGTCDQLGQQRHALDGIQTNQQGNGAMTTTLNVGLSNLTEGEYVVAVFGEPTRDGAWDDDATRTDAETTQQQDETVEQRTDDPDRQWVTGPGGERAVACGAIGGTTMGW
jgi:hypothetical protein